MRTKQLLKSVAIVIVTVLVALPQQIEAQSLSNFNKAMKGGRLFGKPYWFDKDSGINKEKAQKIARENNFVIIENEGRRLKFVPRSEYDAYIAERDFTQRSLYHDANNSWHTDYFLRGNNNYYDLSSANNDNFFYDWYNKQLKGSDFKSSGSAWLYEGGKMIKVDNVRWTGSIKNGMLDGHGDGYIVRDENGKKTYRSFSGGFVGGLPNGEMHMLKSIFYKPKENNRPIEQSMEVYQVGSFSDGMASLSITVRVATGWGSQVEEKKKYGFIDQQGNLAIPCMYDEVKQDFANGRAIVKYVNFGKFYIVINKRNKCVEFQPNQDGGKVLSKWYFANDIFSELRSLPVPKTSEIESEAFKNLSSLEEVTLPEGLREIGSKVFEDCKWLKSVTLPNSIRILGNNVFEGCSSLTSVSVPRILTWKGAKLAFLGCDNLKCVTIRNADGTTTQDASWLQKDKEYLATLQDRWAEENRKEKERAAARASATQRANDITYTITRQTDWKAEYGRNFIGFRTDNTNYYIKTIYFTDGIAADVYRYPGKEGYFITMDWRYETLSDAIAAAYAYAKFGGERTVGRIY